MSQAILSLASAPSHVLHLRRKKVPDELSLPADYVPTDYTSLPPEEPKKRGPNPIFLILAGLLVAGAIAFAVFFLPEGGEPTPTPLPAVSIDITRARMIISQGKLTAQIDATTNAPDGTEVTATLLENDIAFEFFDAEKATGTVTGGEIKLAVPESDSHEDGRESSDYAVQLVLTLPNGEKATETKELEINAAAMARFTGDSAGGADEQPTPTATISLVDAPTVSVEPTATEAPVEPTAAPTGKPVPLENIVVSRPGIIYGTPYGPALQRGTVNTGDLSTIVVKLPVGSETWYLVVVPATGAAGWVNSIVIDLPASDVNRITPVSGEAPFAVVFNGGNVRTSPPGGDVITTVDAGVNVRLQERLGDNSWFKIQLPTGEVGWVSGQLLTINPSVIDSVPVAP